MSIVLSIKNLVTGYKNFPVLRNINFELHVGEFIGIIGPNGSGKTTLLKVIDKILPIWEGEIFLFNQNIKNYTFTKYATLVAFATKISDYSLKYSVEEFLLLARFPFREKESYLNIYSQIITSLEIQSLLNKKLCELSSGELQRVIIAQSIIQTPKLLLLDEPVSHLDIAHQVTILDFIKKVSMEQKITVLSTFHELNLAVEYCDKIILLSNGEIRKMGSPQEVVDYKILEEVYKTTVIVKTNPVSDKPYVFPVPMMWKK